MQVDLNCDLGESFGVWEKGCDLEILPYISSVNIACGFHAGDPATMRITVQRALAQGVAIGAHPGLPDLVGFGRRNLAISPQEAYDMVVYQVGALQGFVAAQGGILHHVKPHGALYNMAAVKAEVAQAIASAVQAVAPEAILYGLAGSELIRQAEQIKLRVAQEVFADRSYQSDGTLTPRSQPGSLLQSDKESLAQVLQMVQHGNVRSMQGDLVSLRADTVCIHGDGAHALQFAQKIHAALHTANITIKEA